VSVPTPGADRSGWPLDGSSFRAFATGLNGPEAVVWDAERNVLYAGGRHGEFYRVHLDGTVEQLLTFGDGSFVLGLALDAAGRIYVCERGNGRLLRVDPDTLEVQTYASGTPQRTLVTPNYLAFAPSGMLYLTDSGTWGRHDGVIYRVRPGGATEIWTDQLSDFPNGIALAPDGSAIFVAESGSSGIFRIPIGKDGDAGTAELIWSRPRTFTDGLAFDADGFLYASMYRPDAIFRVDVTTGRSETVVDDWTAQYLQAPTNVAFAGDSLATLVTANLAGEHLNVLDAPLPAPGLALPRPSIPS
jgi:gluconolactonase